MEKLLRFFILNKKVKKGKAGTFFACLGKYIGVWFILSLVQVILNGVPFLKNLSYNLLVLYRWYMLVGIVLGMIQMFSGRTYENTAFYGKEDVLAFIKSEQSVKVKIAAGAAVLALCLIPHGGNRVTTVKQDDGSHTQDVAQESTQTMQEEASEVQETAETEAVQTEASPVVTQEQKDFYERVKGFWKGDDIDYAFTKWKDDYVFVNSDSYGDVMTNKNFYIAFYTVEEFEPDGDGFRATLRDKEDKGYLVELVKSQTGMDILKIKEETQEEWQILTNNNCATYEEFLSNVGYSACWLELSYFDYYGNLSPRVASFGVNEKDKYCFLDVTDQYEGKELLIYSFDSITVLTDCEGFAMPLYSTVSFKQNERYDPQKKTLWAYYDGGTAGPSYYTCKTYDEEYGGWRTQEQDEIGHIRDNYDTIFFSPLGEEYEAAYSEELERQEQEAQAKADATITFDESMVITEPIDSYTGTFYNQSFPLEITEISEEAVAVKIITGQEDSMHSIGFGNRVLSDDIPEGMAVYSVAGLVLTDTHGNRINANYAVALVLKPDGSVFIRNIDDLKPEFELPEGTYRRKEE